MSKFKKGEAVWCNIGRNKGGNLPWRKGKILSVNRDCSEKTYNIWTIQSGFEVDEKNIVSLQAVEDGVEIVNPHHP